MRAVEERAVDASGADARGDVEWPAGQDQEPNADAAGGHGMRESLLKILLPLMGFGILAALAYVGLSNKEALKGFLEHFTDIVDDWGVMGYVAYILMYAGLEVLALPAIPLTMTAGALFGVGPGTIAVSIAATLGASIAFLISRYLARDRVLRLAKGNKQFLAMDRAISKDGFKVVTLLRLSPLLPFALSNYLYGLTSVDLGSYVAGSWLGMLPGTFAYVAAGSYGKEVLLTGGKHAGPEVWQLVLVGGFTFGIIAYIGRLAKAAMAEIEAEASG